MEMELEGAHDQPDSLTSFLLPVSRPLVRFLITYELRQPHVPSTALALHLVDLSRRDATLSLLVDYAARFHLHSSHVLVPLILYCSYAPLLFAGPHLMTCKHSPWPVS